MLPYCYDMLDTRSLESDSQFDPSVGVPVLGGVDKYASLWTSKLTLCAHWSSRMIRDWTWPNETKIHCWECRNVDHGKPVDWKWTKLLTCWWLRTDTVTSTCCSRPSIEEFRTGQTERFYCVFLCRPAYSIAFSNAVEDMTLSLTNHRARLLTDERARDM